MEALGKKYKLNNQDGKFLAEPEVPDFVAKNFAYMKINSGIWLQNNTF